MILVKNCDLHSMGSVGNGRMDVLVEGGKIKKIGKELSVPADSETIDAAGRIVTPGLVEAHCHLGMGGLAGQNVNEKTDPTIAGMRALDAVDLASEDFVRALKTGVTTLITGPGSSNLIGGTFIAVKAAGDNYQSRIICEEITLKMALGENPKLNYGKLGRSPATRMGAAALIRDALYRAREYREKWLAYQQNGGDFHYDVHLHSLMRAFDGMRVKIHAHQADDILTAIRIAKEFDLRISIDHCTEGMLVLDEVKESGYPALFGPTAGGKGKLELMNKTLDTPAAFECAGVENFVLITDSGVIPMEGLLMQAALFVKHGLSREMAMKGLTINAALATDVAERVGSIEEGKDADLVIWNMHPLDTMAKPDLVMIDGKVSLKDGEVCI